MAKILIIANFCDGSILRGRFSYLADMLTSQGHEVEILTSDFNHSQKKPKERFDNKYKFRLTHIHEPGYLDNISPKRLWSHYVWGRNVYKYLKASNPDWDVIYCAVPSLTATRLAGIYARKHGIKFVTDIQDLWPEAFAIAVKNKLLGKLIFAPFSWYADCGYSKASKVIAVSDTYKDRGLKPLKKGTEGLTVYLGNDGAVFDEGMKNYTVPKPDNEFWIAYIGTLGYSYDLKCVIDAITSLEKSKIPKKIRFVVMGRGPRRDEFEQYAKEKNVTATFTGALPYTEMVGRLCSCDIVVNPIVRDAAQSITNKVGDYALSGLPVVNTQECEEYRNLIDKYRCGINCEVGNSEQVADAILKLINDDILRQEMGNNSRMLGLDRFDRRNTYQQIINFILG